MSFNLTLYIDTIRLVIVQPTPLQPTTQPEMCRFHMLSSLVLPKPDTSSTILGLGLFCHKGVYG